MFKQQMNIQTLTQKQAKKMLDDICNDRGTCEKIGVDYNILNSNDMDKIREYITDNYKIEETEK